jgi:hypothetical protein
MAVRPRPSLISMEFEELIASALAVVAPKLAM